MDYEKKYKEALERARQFSEHPLQEDSANIVEYIFPELELKESDERIRKELIKEINGLWENDSATWPSSLEKKNKYIAWLEKQGEQKPDKVEPKFRNGQWIVWQDKCYKVNYNGCGYELVDQYGLSTSLEYGTIDESAHLWDATTDAKDGNMLSDGTTIFIFKDLLSDGSVMSYCDYDTYSGESDTFCPLSMNLICSKITPATKEQRDTLMEAMADAGYIFDFEKKKLKKIEQNLTWSEEDEKNFKKAINVLKVTNFHHTADMLQKMKYKLIPREETNNWKPSDKQMKALGVATNICNVPEKEYLELEKLYQDLKKLRSK